MIVISVVRDFEMYNRLVKNNKFYPKDTHFYAFDNNKENLTIPKRYNSFLEDYDYSQENWFVFCHEDWEIKEDLMTRLESLDKNALYGPIGVALNWNGFSSRVFGEIENSNKDGSGLLVVGNKCLPLSEVGTFDCQCLIVHSSLIKKYGLRFDKNLSWDLYVEEFCITAREKYDIPSKILALKCQHYSFGNVEERFYLQYQYLQNKFKSARNYYNVTCSDQFIGSEINQKKMFILKNQHFLH